MDLTGSFPGMPGTSQCWLYISGHRSCVRMFIFCARQAFDAVGGFDEKLSASEETR